jgi:TP901 family phage tail tape measure protein
MTDIPVRIVMSITGANAISGALGSLASSFGPAGIAGAVVAGLGVASVKASADFQNAMLQNEAHAGLAASQVNAVNQALLQMGPAVGQGPTQLAEALYPILSGFSGITNQAAKTQVSLTELKLAAQSVAGSTTSVTTVSNAATAAFNALGLQTNNTALATQRMTDLFDIMNTTVSAGNMHWQDYAHIAGKLATATKGTTVTFKEANAALATMTNEGYSARLSETYLANFFTALDLKTDSLARNAKKLGISFDENRFKSMSLAQQIQYLTDITHGNQSEVLHLLNNNATALRTYNALSSGMNQYKSNLEALNHAHGATAAAFATASSGFNFSLQRLNASFQSLGISIGSIFLPALTVLVNALVPVVSNLAIWIAMISNPSNGLNIWLRHLRDSVMLLSEALGFYLIHATTPVLDQLTRAATITRAQFLPSLQSTTSWMQRTGTPVYTSFADTIARVLGGAFRKAQQDAINLQVAISQKLSGVSSKIGITGIPFGLSGLGTRLGGLGDLLGLMKQLSQFGSQLIGWLQPVLTWLQTVFLPGWHAVFDPIGQMFQQIATDMGPQFQQFFQFLQDTVFADFGNGGKGNTSVHDFTFTWKDLWQMIGQVIEIFLKFWIFCSEFIIPIVLRVLQVVMWLGQHLAGPLLDDLSLHLQAWKGLVDWINNNVMPAFGNLLAFLSGFFQWLPGAIGGAFSWLREKFQLLSDWLYNLQRNIAAWFWTLPDRIKQIWINLNLWIIQKFNDLAQSALKWGSDMMLNLANGILDGWHHVQDIINGIGQWIKDHLGFSVPVAGPLSTADEWMPDMMDLFSRGIVAGSPKLQAAFNAAIAPLALSPALTPVSAIGPTIIHNWTIHLSTMARSQNEVRTLVDMIEAEIGRRVRSQTPGYAAFGVF